MNKTMKRLKEVGIFTIILFISLGIIYKLILRCDEWLFKSLAWALSYGLAFLLKSYMLNTKVVKKVLFVILASCGISLSTLFVSGILFSLDDCWSHATYITNAFIWGSIIPNANRYKNGEKKEDKTEIEQEDSCIVV